MIDVLRLDGKIYWVNPHMIEAMEATPDLTLTIIQENANVIFTGTVILGTILVFYTG